MPATKKQRKKAKRVMHEYKHGTLETRGRRKVKSRKQAIAIALSESGQSYKRPKKKGAKTARKAGRKKGR